MNVIIQILRRDGRDNQLCRHARRFAGGVAGADGKPQKTHTAQRARKRGANLFKSLILSGGLPRGHPCHRHAREFVKYT